MPKIPLHLHPSSPPTATSTPPNPLPQFLHTPTGLAILELQGKINFEHPPALHPASTTIESDPHHHQQQQNDPDMQRIDLPVGHLSFPKDAFTVGPDGPAKDAKGKVKNVVAYLYVGRFQRLRGEVKRLAKPWGVLVRREGAGGGVDEGDGDGDGERKEKEAVEVVGVVRWRIVFSMRPEPV